METNGRKTNPIIIITSIFLILILAIILSLISKTYSNYKFEISEYQKNSNKYDELVIENNEISESA